MQRKPRRPAARRQADYPTAEIARSNRRDFLRLLGRGLLAVPVAGLANACGIGREKEEWGPPGDQAPPDIEGQDLAAEDYTLGGIMEDIEYPPRIDAGGIAPMDIEEEDFPPLAGDMPPPDIKPQKDVEDDTFPPLPGEAPFEPDVVTGEVKEHDTKPDTGEEWPVDGDMPMPEE